ARNGSASLTGWGEGPRHPAPRGQPVLGVAAVVEVVGAGVLEVAVHDRDHPAAGGEAGDARPEAADPAHDQVDPDPGLARRVQLLDEGAGHEAVHLGHDARRLAPAGVLGLAADALLE